MCIFCSIAKGEIPSAKVYEDDRYLAFLDLSQATLGHTLVIPKKHISNLSEADPETLSGLIMTVQKVEKHLSAVLGVHDFNILTNQGALAGQSISHLHFHILPRYENDDLKISFTDHKPSQAELKQLATRLYFK